MPEAKFFVYSQRPVTLPIVDSPRWQLRVEHRGWARRFKGTLWLKLCAGSLIYEDNLDAFWAGSTLLPRLPHGVRSLSVTYDLNHKIVPQSMATSALWIHRLFFDRDVRSADAIVAISQGTANRVESMLGRRANAVVYPAASTLFCPPTPSVIQETLIAHGLSQPYLLAVGTLEPRKNLELLIQVFLSMRQDGLLPGYRLVLVGGAGWKNMRLLELLEGHADVVRALGYVADEDLPSLYAGSSAFVFPSVYEGYGIPTLEARMCGAKVLAADIPEIREACGEGGIFIIPDAKGLRDGILQVLAQPYVSPVTDVPSWKMGAAEMAAQFRALIKKNFL
ncbi:MAG: glycosyltransferase family 4 protein [Burkholderiales bacterium]|nr:glycosyltransferase family 4 protein [Burkholderiales bacterium]